MKNRKMWFLAAGVILALTGCGGKNANDYSKYMELGEYKGQTVDRYVTDVTDEEVQSRIESDLLPGAQYNTVTDRAAKEGDVAVVDFAGTVDGQEFEGGSGTGVEIELGAGYYMEDFESEIIGMKPGESKTFEITLPDPYDGVVDGKTASYDLTLNSIIETILPEYNDEYVASISDYATVEEYEAGIRAQLEQEAVDTAQNNACEDLLYLIISNTTFKEIPEEMSKTCQDAIAAEDAQMMEDFGLDNITDLYGEDYDPSVYLEDMAHERMVVYTIAAKEKIELTDEEYQAALEENMEMDGYLSAEDYEASLKDVDSYKYQLLRKKVLDFLAENNNFRDVTYDDFFVTDPDEIADLGGELGTEVSGELSGVADAAALLGTGDVAVEEGSTEIVDITEAAETSVE